MPAPFAFPWAPRQILAGRAFRLPLQTAEGDIATEFGPFTGDQQRYCERDGAYYFYLHAPDAPGDYTLLASREGQQASVEIQVRSLDQLRQRHAFNGIDWPRRWGADAWTSTKRQQALGDMPLPTPASATVDWWLGLPTAQAWNQLPPAELPRAHFVNVHQGCPQCGTAVFKHGGFYPWRRNHHPCDFRSRCPECDAVFPSNDLAGGDYTSGENPDDGYGYFDADGHIYLFAATYHRDQTVAFGAGIAQLTAHLAQTQEPEVARRLGLLLLRYAVETTYLAAVPQFRYGPTEGVEKPWEWGQPDWASFDDPIAALYRKGMVRYCIDVPYISETLAQAYDTVWPFMLSDEDLLDQARAFGLDLPAPQAAADLIEEMLACLVQAAIDASASSNKPRVSQGALVLLRALDRPDGHSLLQWLYDEGPDRLRTFGTNHFFPDGTPFESAGGYNNIHANGLFALEHHLRALRRARPQSYPEAEFPSLTQDPRAAEVALAPQRLDVLGKANVQFGDGGGGGQQPYAADARYAPLPPETLERAAAFTGDERVAALAAASAARRQPTQPRTTLLDGAGVAILRLGPYACGTIYGDAVGHQHVDLLDVQLFAHGRPFLSDLGYPQSWATIEDWEAHWATHNTVWGSVDGLPYRRLGGRGRLLRSLQGEDFSLIELEAERWDLDADRGWRRPGVRYRRLLGLLATDDGGAVLIDCSRIEGGDEHWRICRGLEGTLDSQARTTPRAGTLAGSQTDRGQTDNLLRPDRAGLAWMDQVAEIDPADFKGTWQSRHQPPAWLDVHQAYLSPGTGLSKARATQIMGSPAESAYEFAPLAWRRRAEGPTRIDLVFEPRIGPASLESVESVSADLPGASGLRLQTRSGRCLGLYWNPAGTTCTFADGTRLPGALAIESGGRRYSFGPTQQGRVVALDRARCTVDIEGIEGIKAGERLRLNPEGRGHNYRIEAVEKTPHGLRLRLDCTSVLGRAPVKKIDGQHLHLGAFVLARSGNLVGTRVEGSASAAVIGAENPDEHSTRLELELPASWAAGEWVDVVAYSVGDTALWEPLALSASD